MNPFQSPLCVSGDCAGYDSGLQAHGRFRCPVSCRKLVTGPTGPASGEYLPEEPSETSKGRNRAVKQGRREKQRIGESGRDISAQADATPRLRSNTGGTLRDREPAERGEDGPSVCEYGRNDKTLRGCPTGSCVNGRPPKLADWNLAPQLHPFPNRSPSRQREKPLVFEEVVEQERLPGGGNQQDGFLSLAPVREVSGVVPVIKGAAFTRRIPISPSGCLTGGGN